ncbi:ribosome biogenesis/translation initiation ATPase RLI [Candidatus Woesearchaeota archaeon CG08_land_8_20_14_0_20_47_9]|nr:MAG: ribosome biogenesis/translation initiation ATPase RLI [Candidatus Woesearchaeota archaeon CG08_land_8_20_14_0_20_47_9]
MTRIAIIEKEKCNPSECGLVCMRFCPRNRMGEECIVAVDGRPIINEELCRGCPICTKKCPFNAIHIINLPEEAGKPIHRFGDNGFALYSLPIPIFGKSVGIVGKNGIGKSTALKIIAGLLEPNFAGQAEEGKTGIDRLISFFKGSEAQIFFERVKSGRVRIAYKPQNVEGITRTYNGSVRDLLAKTDEKGMLSEIAARLGIDKVMDNDIKNISGGELQRVAIAATVLKKANLYIFDEPTSFLDIKQRIRVSRFIRELADPETAALVVEHDLIILDYITDLVHIMYGREACFGVVSMPKATRVGINVYLSGYLREENMRFRDNEIKFEAKPPAHKLRKGVEIVSWKGLEKELGNFSLDAEEGGLSKDHVAGILGENGIGKTSFVRVLAGEIKPDKGEVSEKVKVAYKPQYLKAGDELVAAVLKDAVTKHSTSLIKPLQIEPLLNKRLSELSGGELQRVAIAHCLSSDVKLFLLDEPSAYLDVEQRLAVARIIKDIAERRGVSMLIVDHDLLFIDNISEQLIVFEGEPAVHGIVKGPMPMEEGMNLFLEKLGITLRRDEQSRRPRVNKPGSRKDREQREVGKLYYT